MSSIDCVSSRRAPDRRFPWSVRMALAAFFVAAAAGCSWGEREEEPPDTVVMLTLIAMDDVNPNIAGVPSPIVVVFYELAEPQAFEGAEFNQLFYDDGSTLGPDVRARLEFRVEPGEIITTKRVLDPGTRHLGFVAGYREIEGAQWRIVSDVEPGSARSRTLVVGARSLSLPDEVPTRVEDSAYDDDSGGLLDGLTDTLKGVVDAVLPGSE